MLTKNTWIYEDGFGIVGSDIIRRYTLTNANKASVSVMSFGAGIQSIRVPNKNGILGDIVLGWDDIHGYLNNRFIGRTIGRTTSVIIDGVITINSKKYFLSRNNDENNCYHLNGGFFGFDNVNWDCDIVEKSVVMCYLSRDGSEGYPGDMLTQIKYTWTDDNELFINIRAISTRTTVANISNYCLLNLAGQGTGFSGLNQHVITVNSDKWVGVDTSGLPTVLPVVETGFDLRKPTMLTSKKLRQIPGGGFDHILCINSPSTWCYRFHARVLHPMSGRFVEIHSNQPGIHLYTANNFPDSKIHSLSDSNGNYYRGCGDVPLDNSLNHFINNKICKLKGKGGILYKKHGGFLISPQNYLNFLNIGHFPSCILNPGDVYQHNMSFKFGVKV